MAVGVSVEFVRSLRPVVRHESHGTRVWTICWPRRLRWLPTFGISENDLLHHSSEGGWPARVGNRSVLHRRGRTRGVGVFLHYATQAVGTVRLWPRGRNHNL